MAWRHDARQRTLFKDDHKPQRGEVAEACSDTAWFQPPAPGSTPIDINAAGELPPPLVAPDRQWPIDLEQMAAASLPPLPRQQEAISVDRLRTDIDGPPHRFTIVLGDTVEVVCSSDDIRIGRAVEICHACLEVRVRFSKRDRGEWFPVEVLFPVPAASERPRISNRQKRTAKRP
jgi:hypothetical protein